MCGAAVVRCRWLCWFCLGAAARAWSPEGHERIARICDMLLEGVQKDKVRSILQSDLIDMSDWEHKEIEEMTECEKLLYHKQDYKWNCQSGKGIGTEAGLLQCDGNGAEPESLLCGFAYFWDAYVEDKHLKGFPRPVTPIQTPVRGGIDCIYHYPQERMTPENWMRWVVMFIGDMHQPMHWATQYSFGKQIIVYWEGDEMSLYDFWETFIARNVSSVKGKWLNLPAEEEVKQDYTDRFPEWSKFNPVDLVRDWAQDVSQLLCGEVFGPLEENKADGSRTVKNRYKLQEEVVKNWIEMAKKLQKLAAERLAFLFNDILEHRKSARKRKKQKQLLVQAKQGGGPPPGLFSSSTTEQSSTTEEETSSRHPKDWVPPWRNPELLSLASVDSQKFEVISEALGRLEAEVDFPHGLPAPSLHTGLLV